MIINRELNELKRLTHIKPYVTAVYRPLLVQLAYIYAVGQ